jgi:hypothetical protein
VADIAKAALRNRVLEHLGVLAAGETAASADQTWVDEAIDAVHERLRKFGLAPFATSAIPSWAQIPLRDVVAGDVAQSYGMSGQRLLEFKQGAAAAERELARQVAGFKHAIRVKAEYF